MLRPRWVIAFLLGASTLFAQRRISFMGRQVTVKVSEPVPGDVIKRHATVCLEGSPRQCYSAPDYYFRHPKVEIVDVRNNEQSLLFSVETHGTSGFGIHVALLRPSTGNEGLNQLLTLELSNLSQRAFWTESSISDSKIFVTAEWVSGPDEAHYDEHRYIISAYLYIYTSLLRQRNYYLEDRYMTVRKYDFDTSDILGAERDEIISRLKRVISTDITSRPR